MLVEATNNTCHGNTQASPSHLKAQPAIGLLGFQVSERYKTTNYSLNEFLESTIEDWQAERHVDDADSCDYGSYIRGFPEIGVPPVIIHLYWDFSSTKTIQLLGVPP